MTGAPFLALRLREKWGFSFVLRMRERIVTVLGHAGDVLLSFGRNYALLSDEAKTVAVKEAYCGYKPPFNAAKVVRQLLASIPERYLIGLDCIVLTDMAGQPRRNRLGKTTRRGRRIAQSRVAGPFHPLWNGQLPWVELYVDQILRPYPRFALWLPLIRNISIAETLFHEVGHHVHYYIRPEHREKEDVADDWGKKFAGAYLRKKYWYLSPFVRTINFFRHKPA